MNKYDIVLALMQIRREIDDLIVKILESINETE